MVILSGAKDPAIEALTVLSRGKCLSLCAVPRPPRRPRDDNAVDVLLSPACPVMPVRLGPLKLKC
ncbi:MAG TPA: hypothetical protein VJ252_04045, partial [Chthoniobacterales bacterium]|nr:hypothetical protein [Chthoniobacterales bacterium]